NQVVGADREVSISVTSDLPIAAERPMYFDYQRMWSGGHVERGSQPSTALFFAEGYTGSGFDEYLCLANPQDQPARVAVDFLSNSGPIETMEMELPARTRRTINVNQVVGADREVSISVTSDLPIAAERPMYFDYQRMWSGGHVE
ncbi:MAG: DUF5719 family protein, partial [Actinomycetota bacterium]|nr:DUF5719 family protein [Actinomycetota bacterium]